MSFKTVVRNNLRKLGIDVYRYNPTVIPSALSRSLQQFGIDLVLDVGANQGQFATEIRRIGFEGNILSFEPLSAAHSKLLQASNSDAKWDVYSRCALGDHDGEVVINIAKNSLSSSILPMLDSHKDAAPGSIYQGTETSAIKTLDSVAMPYLTEFRAPFLKIDTQGFESKVLDGAIKTLPLLRGILVELSLVPLYEGQHLWMEMIQRLQSEGFLLWMFDPVFSDPRDGRTLQVDGVFYRA